MMSIQPAKIRPPAPDGEAPKMRRTVAWLCAFFAFLNIYAMQPVLPMVMREFGATPVQAGFTVSASQMASSTTCLRTSAWLPAWKAWR